LPDTYVAIFDLAESPLLTLGTYSFLDPDGIDSEGFRNVLRAEAGVLSVQGVVDVHGPAAVFQDPKHRAVAELLHLTVNERAPNADKSITFSLHANWLVQFPLDLEIARISPDFYTVASDGLLAARFDGKEGPCSLYIIRATRDALTAFRHVLDPDRWKAFTAKFEDDVKFLPDFDMRRSAERTKETNVADVGPYSLLGAPGSPVVRHAIGEEFSLQFDRGHVSLSMTSRTFGRRAGDDDERYIEGRPMARPREGSVFQLSQPMIYVLQDRRTGLIILMGQHG